MRLSVLFGVVFVVLCASQLTSSENAVDQQNISSLVNSAIQEATAEYDGRILQSMINGAQSKKKSGRFINKSTPETERMGRIYEIYKNALNILIKKYSLDSKVAEKAISEARQEVCPVPAVNCTEAATEKYRQIDGRCNNLKNPLWGSTYWPLNREVQPAYVNGDEPRGGLVSTLPSPRNVSLAIHKGGDVPSTTVTHMVAQFGQFLDHDISLTPEGGKSCCVAGDAIPSPDPACWHLAIQPDDEFYNGRTRCLDFSRSTATCLVGTHREQMNIITSYIDASNVYGSNEKLTKMLRKFKGGEMEVNGRIEGEFLPWTSDVDPAVSESEVIIAGDVRANEMPGLTVLHTLFLKEHNRIARELAGKTNWSDEQIFQETRRILGAEMQQITYAEYLPETLGFDAMAKYNLSLPSEVNSTTTYDETVDGSIFNSFATAAYRFGHTLVNGLIHLMSENEQVGNYSVRDNYFVPKMIVDTTTGTMPGFELILNGLIRQASQLSDSIISEDMTNYLFQTVSGTFGSDLAARNIQRGRDNGNAGYSVFRETCNLGALTNWAQKPAEINEEAWAKLQGVYSNVADIDLYTGGLSETSVAGGQAGPTFVCLMGIQFDRLKRGDRFFFTHGDQVGSFTPEQLTQLRKRTYGDIICENSKLSQTPLNVFKAVDETTNPFVPCNDPTRQKLDISIFANLDEIPTSTPVPTSTPSGAIGLFLPTHIIFVAFLFSLINLNLLM